jgi:5-methylcytosine-specific restriction endonuclease McrA
MCEVDPTSKRVIRIFRHPASAIFLPPERVAEYAKAYAVEDVRRQVFDASNSECRNCGRPISWGSMHLHEQIPKSQQGEVSLTNSVALCAPCHLEGEHGNRAPQFTKRSKNVLQ